MTGPFAPGAPGAPGVAGRRGPPDARPPAADREVVVLGTASQVPTRHRNHNGYVLRWNGAAVLFDPGEGTQRQMTLAGVRPTAISRICITHFHGDHCLGLPGVLQRFSLDGVAHPVDVSFPASGRPFYERLRHASIAEDRTPVRPDPVDRGGVVGEVARPGADPLRLSAAPLDHGPETFGWRLDEPAVRHLRPDALAAVGVTGAAAGELARLGRVTVAGRTVGVDEVSDTRPGQSMAFVMDTALCDGAFALADGVDLLVCEATFDARDVVLARRHRHLTAADAGRLAAESGVRRLVLTHFSQRYEDVTALVAQAAEHGVETVAAADLARVPLPARR